MNRIHIVADTVIDIGPNIRSVINYALIVLFGSATTVYSRKAAKQVTPNGGSSLIDAINRIETKVDEHGKDIKALKNVAHHG